MPLPYLTPSTISAIIRNPSQGANRQTREYRVPDTGTKHILAANRHHAGEQGDNSTASSESRTSVTALPP
jgi:hypothetical protein